MTREEAIKILKEDGCGYCTWQSINPYECENEECELKEALEMAIQALSQEPCDDVVSRQEALNAVTFSEVRWQAIERIKQLPSVRPKSETVTEFADRCRECGKRYVKRKTGHWEKIVKEHKCYARDDTYTTTEYHCSECGAEPLAEYASDGADYAFSNYCPNCGVRMESEEA